MDTLSITSARAGTVQAATVQASTAQATVPKSSATLASNAAVKAAETASVAQPANDHKQKDATGDAPETPERDSRSLKYLVDGNRVITTIVDDQSKKVVVQIPDAELIRIAKSIDRMQGFFIEQNA